MKATFRRTNNCPAPSAFLLRTHTILPPLDRPLNSSVFWRLSFGMRWPAFQRIFATTIVFSCLVTAVIYVGWSSSFFDATAVVLHSILDEGPPPPLFPNHRKIERLLPQHDLNLPPPEGRRGRYLYMANHVRGKFPSYYVPRRSVLNFFPAERSGMGECPTRDDL